MEHLIERAAVKAGGRAITAEQIEKEWAKEKNAARDIFDAPGAARMSFQDAVAVWERHLIEQAWKASNGNKSVLMRFRYQR